ncbi:MAG: segregation and condensation protein A [Eubacterium sp.]|jgi:segregation and condensation protein A
MSYKVTLPEFEGPFDLLVYLIESSEMSIYDIRISEITEQYMTYLHQMQDWNIELSSEFMVLASELLRIKSKMLLPGAEKEKKDQGVVREDPREDLVQQLLEYKRCKAAGKVLQERAREMEDVYVKPQEDLSDYTEHPDEYLRLGTEEFIRAFSSFLHRKKRLEDTRKRYTTMRREKETMENRMAMIRDVFLKTGRKDVLDFRQLVPSRTRMDAIVSFLAVLQMVRGHYLNIRQWGLYGEIELSSGSRPLEQFSPEEEAERADEDGAGENTSGKDEHTEEKGDS